MVITPILAKEAKAQRGPVPAQMDMASRATESSSLACLLCMWSVCSELEGVVVCMGGGSPVLNLLAGLGEWSRVQAEADGGGHIDHMWPGERVSSLVASPYNLGSSISGDSCAQSCHTAAGSEEGMSAVSGFV